MVGRRNTVAGKPSDDFHPKTEASILFRARLRLTDFTELAERYLT
jgi:hypothetical protein